MVKSLNNNLVLVCDDQNDEYILFGKGIGFKKKKGDLVEDSLITKIFQPKHDNNISLILENISEEILMTSEVIISYGEKKLEKKLNDSLLIALADHIQNAVSHYLKGVELPDNSLKWEIPFLYHNEYIIGQHALEIIEEHMQIKLPDIEASFIALHFVNAQDNKQTMNETILITDITKSIVKIIQLLFEVSLNKKSINYSRFVTHIRYFMNRQLHSKEAYPAQNKELFYIVQEQYPKSYACSLMIREILTKKYNIQINDDEMTYLIIHIERVDSETK